MLDGRKVGTTDINDLAVSPGDHRVRVEKNGYESYRKRAHFKSGPSKPVYVILEKEAPAKGSLYVNTEPAEARVRILNIEPKFYQGIDLETGRYQVEVTAKGYEKRELSVSIDAGEDKEVNVSLKRRVVASKPRYQTGGSSRETDRDGRFIAYANGTVLDSKTGLMWASKDNGEDINWQNAKRYCEKYRGGGYTDWRMPTQDELAGLYDKYDRQPCKGGFLGIGAYCDLCRLIDLTGANVWAPEARGSEAAYFNFGGSLQLWDLQSDSYNHRALPVRSGN